MRAVLQADTNDDLMVVNAARVSFSKRSTWLAPGVLSESDQRLLHYLARHQHWSPFAHPQLLVQLRMSEGEMLGWLLRRNPAGFRTYRCQAPDEYLEKGSLYAWAQNLRFLPREVAIGIAAILWKRFPYSARALCVPQAPSRGDRVRPVSLRSVTDEWMARDLQRAVLSTRSFVIEAALPVARQLVKHKEGFCVTGDTEITFDSYVLNRRNGPSKETIKRLFETWSGHTNKFHRAGSGRHQVQRRNIRVLNIETGLFESSRIADVIHSGRKPVYEIVTKSGAVKMTAEHRIWTPDGWQELQDAVGLTLSSGGIATMSKTALIGRNGLPAAGSGRYRDRAWLEQQRAAGLDVQRIANAAGCSYFTIRKWLKIHGLQFDPRQNLSGVNGSEVWNKGKRGYKTKKLSAERRAHLRELRSGPGSNFWRGGSSTDREKINGWTGRMARSCHERHGFTCQKCGQVGGSLQAHHVVPVTTDSSLAYAFDNLASLCRPCHASIHQSPESELAFAKLMQERGRVVAPFLPKRRAPGGNPLRVHFERIEKITYLGEDDVYDLSVEHESHNFVGNGFVLHNCWNEASRRYVDTTPLLETPTSWRRRAATKKQGSSQEPTAFPPIYLAVDENEEVEFELAEVLTALRDGYDAAVAPDGPWQVCPEQARYVLPQSMLTEWWWTGSVADFARVCRDRLGAGAQSETTDVARAISSVFQEICPLTWRALVRDSVGTKN